MKKAGCPACYTDKLISTSRKSFDNDYEKNHTFIQAVKYGELIKCNRCKMLWFVPEADNRIDTIPEKLIHGVTEWNSRQLTIKADFLDILHNIGATPPDIYGNMSEYISIPCKCTLTNGKTISDAVVSIQRKPPVGSLYYDQREYYYMDDVVKIEPSEYALPFDVRVEIAKAREMTMCYAPTVVCAPNNQMYITNGSTNFFNEDGILGREITIPTDEQRKLRNAIDTKMMINEIRIIADWCLEYEKIFSDQTNKIKRINLNVEYGDASKL